MSHQNYASTAPPMSAPLHSSQLSDSSPPCPQSQSASFQLPRNMSNASLIGDCSFGVASASDYGDESLSLDVNGLRASRPIEMLPAPAELGYQRSGADGEAVFAGSTTPTKVVTESRSKLVIAPIQESPAAVSKMGSSAAIANLKDSTLLPSSPAKSAHLLESTHALSRVEPPGSGVDVHTKLQAPSPPRSVSKTSDSPSTSSLSSAHHELRTSQRIIRQSPLSDRAAEIAKSKRKIPASISGSSLASVGEEAEHRFQGDVSTLFPVSPEKTKYLLRDEEMIMRETLPRHQEVAMSKRSPAKSVKSAKTVTSLSKKTVFGEFGDVTLDIGDLMAKMQKPKRASGTEESFVDLLHGNNAFEGADSWVLRYVRRSILMKQIDDGWGRVFYPRNPPTATRPLRQR